MLDVKDVFEWQAISSVPGETARRCLVLVANDLNVALREAGEPGVRALQEVYALPDLELVRILRAPETMYQLRRARKGNDVDAPRRVRRWVSAERAQLDPDYVVDEDTWSALGDVYVPRGAHHGASNDACEWRATERYRGPILRDTIAVDFFSPYARRPPQASAYREKTFGASVAYERAVAERIVSRIAAALDALRTLSVSAHDFVVQMARVIVPRQDARDATFYTSSSSRMFIGRIILNNAHNDVSAAALTSSLVHEATHALLYMKELDVPLARDRDALQGVRLISPWTGGRLGLDAYMHACVVWFGLMKLWSQPAATAVYPPEDVQRELARARAGFEHDILAGIRPLRAHLAPGWLGMLESVQEAAA